MGHAARKKKTRRWGRSKARSEEMVFTAAPRYRTVHAASIKVSAV
jgi:hypothetical protein